MYSVRVAVPADARALASTLAEAFDGDPVWDWMIPQRNRRSRLELIFGALLRQAIPNGQVYTTGDRRAVAMWSPPGKWRVPLPVMLRAAVSLARAAGTRLPRLMGRLGEIERVHEAQDQRHWYLEFIGSAIEAQGSGLGAALLTDALQRYDRTDMPVYLESSNPRNLPFYQRHGFHIVDKHDLRAGPPQWTLWRDPQVGPTMKEFLKKTGRPDSAEPSGSSVGA